MSYQLIQIIINKYYNKAIKKYSKQKGREFKWKRLF